MALKLIHGDCLDVMPVLAANSIDTIITDPPYGLEFMGKEWDHGVPGVPFWSAALRVAKPGATLLAFGGTRTYHRLAVSIEDAGWELRDCFMWLYGSGFPKGHDVAKRMDGSEAERWAGWNPSLKPAWEPIIVAMKPLYGTFVTNAQRHGVAGFNIDECRIEYRSESDKASATPQGKCTSKESAAIGAEPDAGRNLKRVEFDRPELRGRYPANLLLDEEAATQLDAQTGILTSGTGAVKRATAAGHQGTAYGRESRPVGTPNIEYGDSGGASRFFYCAKAPKSEKGKYNTHPTVKPLTLMEYLCKLTKTPTGGLVLDPFTGSATTGVACLKTGRDFIGIEKDESYYAIAVRRLEEASA
jgi:site-specific DNA-methyltransferase (adenine-specific)